MIVFAALTPHTPLLLSTIGQEHEKELTKTLAAFRELKKKFHASSPETIIIISPHNQALSDALALNLAETYEGNLSDFGDFKTKPKIKSDSLLINQLQKTLRDKNQPITLLSSETLDYGATIPIALLEPKENQQLIPLIPSSELSFKIHFTVGESLKDILTDTTKRVAIIVSSNLSHRLSSDAPGGFSPKGEEFDSIVREALETKNLSRLISLSPELVQEAGQCGFRGLLILLGILSGTEYTPHLLSYEHPFGVGYLTAEFVLG